MRYLVKFLLFTCLILSNTSLCAAHKRIGITQIVEHPSLNKIREGIVEVLKEEYGPELEIVYENAQGNTTIATQIAQKFAGMKLDLIIPISTPSSQATLNTVTKTPVVFTAVSDPVEAHIIDSTEKPGGNKTGVMDIPPLKEQLNFITTLLPGVKTIGFPFNPGEANSVVFLRRLEELAPLQDITIMPAAVTKSADVGLASQTLVGRVDAIFIATDNMVVSGLESLIKICDQNNIPLFASDSDSVDRGAYAALAYDQKDIGRITGKLAIRVLSGENPGNIPVMVPTEMSTSFNPKTAAHLVLPASKEGLK